MRLIDPELLRTFIAFADSGTLARAASAVARSPSAVTAQMQRLEELVGESLLASNGRGRVLTPAGEEFALHARRVLDAHREAWLSVRGAASEGRVVLGATQDFTDSLLPGLLRTFARTHPRVRFELRVGRSAELSRMLAEGLLDVLIAMRLTPEPDEVTSFREPMVWLAADQGLAIPSAEVPLALLDSPCSFRDAAIGVLEQAGRPFRLAVTSASLAGLVAAVRGGVAVTLRTPRWIGNGLAPAPDELALSAVPEAEFSLRLRRASSHPAETLAGLIQETLQVP